MLRKFTGTLDIWVYLSPSGSRSRHMSLADDLAKLEELRRSGALSETEFAQAKASLLNAPASPPEPSVGAQMAAQLDEVRFQNELARIDREWEMEREQYLVADRRGRRHVPTVGGSVIGGLIVVGIGIVWTVFAFGMAQSSSRFLAGHPMAGESESMIPWLLPSFGVLFIIAGIAMSLHSYSKAQRYERGYQSYQQRRQQVLEDRAREEQKRI
jgi:hypothetical protein